MSEKLPAWLIQAREHWQWRGQRRPPFALEPKEGQESVWDYPRPPRIAPEGREVLIFWGNRLIGRSVATMKVQETSHPPCYYLPKSDLEMAFLKQGDAASFCEWKGQSTTWSLVDGPESLIDVGWSYEAPLHGADKLAGHLAFYPGDLNCTVGGLKVSAQPGGFYGGWITDDLAGPFKGVPGSQGW